MHQGQGQTRWYLTSHSYLQIDTDRTDRRHHMQVDVPKEATRIKAKGGVTMQGGQRVVSPSGHHSLNMARTLGDADYKTPHRIVSAVPDMRHVALGCTIG